MIKAYMKTELGVIEEVFHALDQAQKYADFKGYRIYRAKRMNQKSKRKEVK